MIARPVEVPPDAKAQVLRPANAQQSRAARWSRQECATSISTKEINLGPIRYVDRTPPDHRARFDNRRFADLSMGTNCDLRPDKRWDAPERWGNLRGLVDACAQPLFFVNRAAIAA